MNDPKTLLLLGGSAQQVVAIDTAKKLGYRTILCDYLPDNPGQYHADKFYLTSTTDMEAVLEIARKERIHGIVAYASDPAAPTAAYVAEKLELPGIPYASARTLCNKDLFRVFLTRVGLNAPQACGYSDSETAMAELDKFRLPVIIKPVDSSGSKGATVLRSWDGIVEALEFAFSFSRSHRIIVEEFIEKKHPYLIGGDIFVLDGQIVMWGLMNCHRDSRVNPLVPVGKSYPPDLEEKDLNAVKKTLQTMVDALQIRCGAMNVEIVVDKNGRVWPIDVGPRNGGNMIPELLGYIFGVDVVELTVKAAMGEPIALTCQEGTPYYATHNLHSNKNGVFEEVVFAAEIEPFIIRKSIYKKPGDNVEYFDNAAKALGIVFFKFSEEDQMRSFLPDINRYVSVVLKGEEE